MRLKEEKISAKKAYMGTVLSVEEAQVKCPNGNLAPREIVRHTPGAGILAITSDNKIILERQFRYAFDEVLYEIPAGKQEIGEEPLTIVKRELEEETGFKPNHIELLGKIYPTCGYCDEIIYLYYATDLIETKKHWDENEFIEISYHSLEEVESMIKQGIIVDAKTICAISLYKLKINNK